MIARGWRRWSGRAQIVLASAAGDAASTIGAQVGVSRPPVPRWLDRSDAEGRAGRLADRPRAGRAKQMSVADEAAIIARTLHTAPPSGTHWSTRLMAVATGDHPATIRRMWRAHGLTPHRVKPFTVSTDPDFVAPWRDVVGLYLQSARAGGGLFVRGERARGHDDA